MSIERFETANSVYEVDQDARKIRRVSGVNAPTPSQGVGGEWREYQRLGHWPDASGRLLVRWDADSATLTSPLQTAFEVKD